MSVTFRRGKYPTRVLTQPFKTNLGAFLFAKRNLTAVIFSRCASPEPEGGEGETVSEPLPLDGISAAAV